jgi:putative hydrolase of the HAD superfamily
MLFLFDVDGVLNKSPYFTEKYAEEFQIDICVFDDFFQNDFLPTLTDNSDLLKILPKHFVKWKWDKSSAEFLAYWFQNDVKIDNELLLIIRHYRSLGIKIGIASQQEKYRKDYLLSLEGLGEEFDCFYFSCDLGYLKSDRKFYETVLEYESSPIFFWDDTPALVEKANQCGFQAYLYHDNQKLKQQIDDILKHNEF